MTFTLSLNVSLRENPYSGKYIAIEGIDGSGKSTQAQKIKEYFELKGNAVVTTYEPNLSLFGGEDIVKVFTSKKKIPPQALQYLLSANRLINLSEIVEPTLEKGHMLITDRSFWSAVVYGCMDLNNTYSLDDSHRMLITQSILSMYHQSIVPDITFYLSVSAETGITRLQERKKSRENDLYEKREKLEKVVEGYTWLVKNYPEQLIQIDGERAIDEITQDMIQIIETKLL